MKEVKSEGLKLAYDNMTVSTNRGDTIIYIEVEEGHTVRVKKEDIKTLQRVLKRLEQFHY